MAQVTTITVQDTTTLNVAGVGAELTGGNFWQGALVEGIVAGLNHGLHYESVKSTMKSSIENADMNPDRDASIADAPILVDKLPELKRLKIDGGVTFGEEWS